jgi:iron complex outermembrane receptor protein
MNRTALPLRRPLAAAVGAIVAGSAAPALAQDVRVEVTGSNIKRVDVEGALPVTVMSRDEIERTGSQSVPELLQYLASNASANATLNVSSIGAQTNSVSNASLRALGGQNTLVLINGKRIAQASGEIQGTYGVNLDSIPFAAIERIEILKDGASAIYGSDAIAGVINFIMRQDYQGAEVSGYYGTPTRGGGGGDKWNASGTFGFGDLAKDKYNLFVNAYYQKAESLDQNKRNFSRSSIDLDQGLFVLSGHNDPAHAVTLDGVDVGSPGFPNCGTGRHYPELDQFFGPRCFYDPAAADGVNSIPETETTSLYASGRWQFHPSWQLYGTAAYTKVDTRYAIQPTPLSSAVTHGPLGDQGATIIIRPSNPHYPTALAAAAGAAGQPLELFWRAYALGLRDTTDKNEAFHGVVGTQGSAFNWDWDASFSYSRNETSQVTNGGFVRYSEVLPLLNSDRFNPFGPQTPEFQRELDATQFRAEALSAESTGYLFEAKGTGELYKLPAGSLAAAVGLQVGRSELEQRFHPALQVGDVTGYGGNNADIDADRDYWAAFAEINIPILRNLEVNAAVRFDDYSDFGSTTNPKVSVRWTPLRQLLVRGSWGTGFVAPTLTQAYGATTIGLSEAGLDDPLRCPVTGAVLIDCAAQFNVLFGGNPNLRPQKSDQFSAGIVWEPVTGTSIGFDWFHLTVEDQFSNGPAVATILGDLDRFGSYVTRGPGDASGLPGRITSIDQRFINIGEVEMDGFDIDIKARTENTRIGRFLFSLNGTYYRKYDVTGADGTTTGQVANQFEASTSGLVPRYKQYATITWENGPWSATLGNLHQNSYVDVNTDGNNEQRRVGTLSLWDLSTTYKGFRNLALTLGVQNLFDRDPPFTNQSTTFQLGYDPTYYDARARFVYAKATYTFK